MIGYKQMMKTDGDHKVNDWWDKIFETCFKNKSLNENTIT